MSEAEKLLGEALAAYDFGGQLVGAVRYGSGHINDTFVVHTQPGEDPCRRFILQRISSAAFKHPDEVMANIVGVTSFLGRKIKDAGGALTEAELDYLPWGAKLMTLECGIRFLTDYLEGDHYFRTHRDGQNLDRCRTQFKLVSDMEAAWDDMKAVVNKYR